MKRKLFNGFAILAGLAAMFFLINETPFLYFEPSVYTLPDPANYFSPQVAPVLKINPSHDTMIIFFHGFPSSPQEFRSVAERLSGQYDVSVPLLPGFGTTPEAMKKSYFSQWLAFARDEYMKYRGRYRRVYVCGQSMGGTLVLRLVEGLNAQAAPDGVILLSTPVFLNRVWGSGVLYDWRLYISRMLAWFISEIHTTESRADQDGADWVGFKGVKFLKQIHSLKMGMYQARGGLAAVRVPVLLMHAKGDKTVPFENVLYLPLRLAATEIHIRIFDLRAWKHTRHLLSMYRTTQGDVVREIQRFIQERAGGSPVTSQMRKR